MLAGDLYDASDPELVAARERARGLTREYNRTEATERERRRELLDDLFGSVGDGVEVEPPFRCDYGSNLHVGENFYANFDCVVLDAARVEVGDDCQLAPGVHIYTATHPLDAADRTAGPEYAEPVTLGDDVWVGGRAVVNPGVTVGDGAVVGSGSVVTDDVPAGVVVAGNPARLIERIE